jgi:hypothetical protein
MAEYWDYPAVGGSHDGLVMRVSERFKPGDEKHILMRAPGKVLRPDPDGRMELYRLEHDGKLYFLNVRFKDGKRVTPPGEREPSRVIRGIKYFDYRFVGGSHDGTNMSLPNDFPDGFAMGIDMRGERGPLPGGKKEVYKLGSDRRFQYQNAIMKDGKQVTPPRES